MKVLLSIVVLVLISAFLCVIGAYIIKHVLNEVIV